MAYTDGPETSRPALVRFEIISEAWQRFSANMTPWLLAILFMLLVTGAILGPFYATVFASSFASAMANKGEPSPGSQIGSQLIGMVFGTGVNILQFVFLGGMVKMAIRQLRGEAIAAGDVFSGFRQFAPLALAGLLYTLGVQMGTIFCILPGLLLAGLWMLTVPFIVDQNLDPIAALTASMKALQPQMWMALCLYFVLSLVAGIGALLCGIGMIFTYPLLPIGTALLYRDFFPERFQTGSTNHDDF
jgi:uncharacterized membrane protein